MMRQHDVGFTLIEALVALSVLAVSAAFLLAASENHARNTAALGERMVAQWVAQNHLTALQVGRKGANTHVEMAGIEWQLDTEMSATQDPDLARADIRVSRRSDSSNALAHITAFLDGAARR